MYWAIIGGKTPWAMCFYIACIVTILHFLGSRIVLHIICDLCFLSLTCFNVVSVMLMFLSYQISQSRTSLKHKHSHVVESILRNGWRWRSHLPLPLCIILCHIGIALPLMSNLYIIMIPFVRILLWGLYMICIGWIWIVIFVQGLAFHIAFMAVTDLLPYWPWLAILHNNRPLDSKRDDKTSCDSGLAIWVCVSIYQ